MSGVGHRLTALGRARRLSARAGLAFLVVTLTALLLAGPVLGSAALAAPAASPAASAREEVLKVPVGPEPDGSAVTLDATLVTPADDGKHPAVLLAHGFGGSKADLLPRARELAASGYSVLAYTARGFGASGGRIHLDDPDYEVADGKRLIDLLAGRPEVQLDAGGDPRVGVAGGSYGGALALMLAGVDARVDAVVAAITWNDLAEALLPGRRGANEGVFKRRWASIFFASAVEQSSSGSGPADVCGRFDPTICRVFLDAADTSTPSPLMEQLLRSHSPAAVAASVRAPTLLLQGMRDSFVGLDQADATARALAASGVPVAVRWFDGGHDGGTAPADAETLRPWLQRYLTDEGRAAAGSDPAGGMPLPAFSAPIRVGGGDRQITLPAPPRLDAAAAGAGSGAVRVGLAPATAPGATATASGAPAGRAPRLLSPPGGDPSAISSAGGLSGADGLDGGSGAEAAAAGAAYAFAALPGQHAAFDTSGLAERVDAAGAPRVRLRITSTTKDAVLFASLWRMTPAGPVSPRGQVVPIRVATTPGTPVEVDVPLPAGTYSMAKGSQWRVLISATDAGYAIPADARFYTVELADAALVLPSTTALTGGDQGAAGALAQVAEVDSEVVGVATALAALLLAGGAAALFLRWRGRRLDRRGTRSEDAGVPLVVDGLVKTYKDGHVAVDDVSWRVEAGQVVGLLGPNGAGKTTTMRMLVGLIRPDSGSVHVLGEPVHAGSRVLRRVGALIEGPGFLPHLTGRQNLLAYWEATGRDPEDAHLEQALDVAALGDAVDRPVRTYSQGMRQRLGIAQAMLGLPDVLLLDEPTNGLDPPQIAAMRPILRDYAATGRTVVISSHLLSEVEQTCTHVVVMNRGRVVTTGSVADLVTGDGATIVTLGPACDPQAITDGLRVAQTDFGDIRLDASERTLTVAGTFSRGELVAALVAAGADVESVVPRRRLEEVFLGVIGGDNPADPSGNDPGPRMDSLRKVRAR